MDKGYYKPRKTLMKKSEIKKIPKKPNTNSAKSNKVGGYTKRKTKDYKKSGIQKGGGYSKPRTRSYNPTNNVIWVLLVFLVIGIIVVLLFFTNALDDLKIGGSDLGSQDLEMKISSVQIENDSIDIKMDIDPKDEKLVGIKIIVDDGKNFDIIKVELTPEQIEKGEIHIELDKVDGTKVTKILISPILENEKELPIIGSVKESYIPKESDFVNKRKTNNYNKDPRDTYYPYDGPRDNFTQKNISNCNFTCEDLNNECGNWTICGNQTNCGTCNSGFVCNSSGFCIDEEEEEICEENCSLLNYECGNWTICGNQTNCGTCNSGFVCNSSGFCIEESNCEAEFLSICNESNVYWYDSCGIRGEIKDDCKEDEKCYINECVPIDQAICGNNILETGEYCEPNNLVGENCESFGYISGILRCNSKCAFDLRECIEPDLNPSCESQDYYECFEEDIWWYNSCDEKETIKQECEVGCQQDFCLHIDPIYCTSGSDCNDNNACTSDACVYGSCFNNPLNNCCTSASQCSDGNSCTTDTCVSNTCYNSPISNCCTSASQCSDGNSCTTDTCVSNTCYNTNACTSSQTCTNGQCVNNNPSQGEGFIVDHTSALKIGYISEYWINKAKDELHIAYAHTSHGNQLSQGMEAIISYNSLYSYSMYGSSNSLHYEDYVGDFPQPCKDLSRCDGHIKESTQGFLNSNSDINVMMWSWCNIADHDIQGYLSDMQDLIIQYPNVHFVFMTGHANGGGEGDSSDIKNQEIRDFIYNNPFCNSHECILFDFADMEEYDPDGNYFLDKEVEDDLRYDGGNWASEYLQRHPNSREAAITQGVRNCAHSDDFSNSKLNCALKGEAAWYMFAKMVGYEG
jgi:hypothetical protein